MLINLSNRSSSSSSPHSNKYIEQKLTNDNEYGTCFTPLNQLFTNSSNSCNRQGYSGKGYQSQQNHNSSNNNALNDDLIVMDEVHDDHVYQVTIRKVYNQNLLQKKQLDEFQNTKSGLYGTYRPLSNTFYSYLNDSDQNNNNSTNPNNNESSSSLKDGLVYTRIKTKLLKHATLPKLIEHFTNEETGQIDSNLVQIFLATYRTFADVGTAFKVIRKRYEQIVPASLEVTEDVRQEHLKSFRQIFQMWLENYAEDFNEPPDFPNLNELKKFAKKYQIDLNLIQVVQSKYEINESSNIPNLSEKCEFSTSLLLPPSLKSESKTLIERPNQAVLSNTSNASNTSLVISSSSNTKANTHSSHRRSFSNLTPNSLGKYTNQEGNAAHSLISSRSQNNLLVNSDSKLNKNSSTSIGSLSTNSNLKKSHTNIINSLNNENLLNANFLFIDSVYFAEQLTVIDKILFSKVCAHLCLGGVWSTRYQKTQKIQSSLMSSSSLSSASTCANGSDNLPTKLTGSTSSPTTSSIYSTNSTPILSDKFSSIGAFIDQFNCVSFVVQATILEKIDLKPSDRAKIIKKWIEIAQACRNYKNFSSLNAIVQGLNTQCVSRLEKTWNEVPSDYKLQFEELTQMFSEDQNQKMFRQILAQDLEEYAKMFDLSTGTPILNTNKNNLSINNLLLNNKMELNNGKYVDINSGINATLSRKYKENIKKLIIKNRFREPVGTIPFLGTFIKDLEYIHAQNPTKLEKGLINIMQKRKEFEIISQIKMLQHASQLYSLNPNLEFNIWLHNQTVYSEEQNYKLSYLIEPRGDSDGKTKTNNILSNGSRSDSIESINSTNNRNSKAYIFSHSRNSSYGNELTDSNRSSNFFNSPQTSSRDTNEFNSDLNNTQSTNNNNDATSSGLHKYNKSTSSTTTTASATPNLVVKVSIDLSNQNGFSRQNEQIVASTVVYKRIYIKDSDRTKEVKRSILEKFLLNPETCDKYSLIQIFNNSNQFGNDIQQKELIIGDNCNVYYAAKNVPDMQFVLRNRITNNTSSANLSYSNSYNNLNYITQKSNNSNGSKSNASPMLTRANKIAKNLVTGSSSNHTRNQSQPLAFTNINSVISRYDDLPPQSPSYQNKQQSNHIYKKTTNDKNQKN